MPELLFSVIIPTRDRRKTLEQSLSAFAAQTMPIDRWEMIVVDDASVDDTVDFLRRDPPLPLRILRASGDGPARARNLGIAAARAQRILLMGDDMIPAPDLLEAHRQAGGASEEAVQGRIEWDPESEITEIMRFMAPEGPQFYFRGLQDGDRIPFSRIYGANFSAPRDFFLQEPFDERFRFACMEDTEMAWRWRQRGWSFQYAERARCFHRHHYSRLEHLLERQKRAGSEARTCVRIHPKLVFPLFLLPAIQCLRSLLKAPIHLQRENRWWLRCRLAYLAGYSAFSRTN